MKQDILPQGDLLRQLLVKSSISNTSINSMLREKGLFLGHNEKNNSVPLLMKSFISPRDFLFLQETQKLKEDKNNYITKSIMCSSDFEFSDLLAGNIDLHNLVENKFTYNPGFKIAGNPTFYYEDSNTAIFEFEIERENLLEGFYNSKTHHTGSIKLKKTNENDIQISVQQNSTSKETLEVNKILMSVINDRLLTKTIIKSYDDIIAVKFNHFDNASRINFFYSFSSHFDKDLEFLSITDIDLYLDEKVKSHNDIKVFLNELDNLKLSGKVLQNHILITKKEYFPKLIFGAIKFKYKVFHNGIEGLAQVNLGFPTYVKNKDQDSEFQISIDLFFDKKVRNSTIENDVRKKLLDIFEKQKIVSYDRFKSK